MIWFSRGNHTPQFQAENMWSGFGQTSLSFKNIRSLFTKEKKKRNWGGEVNFWKKVYSATFFLWLVCWRFLDKLKTNSINLGFLHVLSKRMARQTEGPHQKWGQKKRIIFGTACQLQRKEGNQGLSTKYLVSEKIYIIKKFAVALVFKVSEVL